MMLEILKFVAIQTLLVLVALIEHVVGLPILTVTLFLVFAASFSSLGSLVFLLITSLFVATIFSGSWLLVFSVLALGMAFFRSPFIRSRGVVMLRLLLVTLLAVVIAMDNQPTITIALILHSIVSAVISVVVLSRFIKFSGRSREGGRLWLGSHR